MSVSELNAEVRSVIERQFASVWVEGEIVNFMAAPSGHWYFNLNDGSAQIKCVCWKGQNFRIRFKPQNGVTVRIRGKLSFYEARGETQIVVESLEPSGEGALAAAYEQIKAKLYAEGLFADELKRPIPFFPRKVAVITSKSGAAYHDILTVLTRRARSVSILLIPTLVQVARAIRASEIPVISAVGHEIDVTIADFVADVRAATPSAAAEIVAGREEDILYDLDASEERLASILNYKMLDATTRLREAVGNMQFSFSASVQRARSQFADAAARLTPATLRAKAVSVKNMLDVFDQRRTFAMEQISNLKSEKLKLQMAKLDALSPLGVLTRGYSITQGEDGAILRDAKKVKAGEKLKIRLERGKLNAEVLSSEE